MRRIINGIAYDTEKAAELVSVAASIDKGDHAYWEETLYRTPKNSYFLAGRGGPKTTWAERFGNTRSAGSGLRALTELEAREWVERWANEKYEAIFGPVTEA